ncbi:MAG: bifunctional 5,10-methylenetetrahydrofolate dehydrogenase/5,10-methenyltetrahydrofolate cyclohydrolase [Rickettsiales bacterium]|jgi:methylenetetrahydrofolate dehydrogenase (NADP+)/methenyltetrahydrofolate cyclohydrolase|nr:bifunctional 5,10-methylenetetrahydrofolate dehydrogenase/5,10-methenyltetrahydrofolate cyclohydrolase [Rickettsiales bacterium]
MQLIDGQKLAKSIILSIADRAKDFSPKPCLAVIMVGNNSASKIYVKNKEKACRECGFESVKYELSGSVEEREVINLIEQLNQDRGIDGILIQLPLPDNMEMKKIISTISPDKDVDCFHPLNVGKLFGSQKNSEVDILPCTASGCLKLIKSVWPNLAGKNAVIVGRSNIVGRPTAQLLLNEDCSVTITHSKSKNLEEITKNADILVVAVGIAKFIGRTSIKNGAVVIDVGINRLENGNICGDVDFEDTRHLEGFLSPVPGGAGPMTVACLMYNTYQLFLRNKRIPG